MSQHKPKEIISVKEAIMRRLIDDHKKWYSSRLIAEHLNAELGRKVKPTCYLLRLIKSGHVERAYKPKHLINSKNGKKEFIYRWSGRPYQDEIERISRLPYNDITSTDKAKFMSCVKACYPNLPDWYRRMML